MGAPPTETERKAGAWIDLAAFAGGLALAWFAEWRTTDLVWSLWLSSLMVGYATIVWSLSGLLREFAGNAWRDRAEGMLAGKLGVGGLLLAGTLFGIAFFTVHFGGFHYVHSVFLQMFFPVGGEAVARDFPGWTVYARVVREYWLFVPLAFLAERESFRGTRDEPADTAVTPEAIARRKAAVMRGPLMAPYRNVIRLHLLIFFFAAAHFLRLEHFAVYAVVYAVYFFPWRVVKAPGGK